MFIMIQMVVGVEEIITLLPQLLGLHLIPLSEVVALEVVNTIILQEFTLVEELMVITILQEESK